MAAAIGASAVMWIAAPVLAATPKPGAVEALAAQIRSAIRTAERQFEPRESAADEEAAIQAAITSVISNGADPMVAQAALNQVDAATSASTPLGVAVEAVLQIVGPAAAQESLEPTSVSNSTTNTARTVSSYVGITAGGAANGAGGGGGYIAGR